MPWLLGGLALAIGLGIAFAGRDKKPAQRRVPARPTPEEVDRAAAAIQAGEGTAEDMETLSDHMDAEGEPEAAARFAEAAASAPEAAMVAPEAVPAPSAPEAQIGPAEALTAPTSEGEALGFDEWEPFTGDETLELPEAPAGFNPASAASHAQAMANHIRSRQFNYSRPDLRQFQVDAGVTADGIYGAGSQQALIFFGATNAPRPLFRPRTAPSYEDAHPELVRIIRG